jgi:thiol-disulfide isomerase/thioredoxin
MNGSNFDTNSRGYGRNRKRLPILLSLSLLGAALIYIFIFSIDNSEHLNQIFSTVTEQQQQKKQQQSESSRDREKISARTKKTSLSSIYSLNTQKLNALNSLDIPLVLAYFSPWCSHCKHFIPLFTEYANNYERKINESIKDNKNLQNGSFLNNFDRNDIQFRYNTKSLKIAFGTINCE